MTKAERSLVLNWSDRIFADQQVMKEFSKELREMGKRRGYGGLPLSPEESLRYLFTVDDQRVHTSALSIYSQYRELEGRLGAMRELIQGFTKLTGKEFQVSKGGGA